MLIGATIHRTQQAAQSTLLPAEDTNVDHAASQPLELAVDPPRNSVQAELEREQVQTGFTDDLDIALPEHRRLSRHELKFSYPSKGLSFRAVAALTIGDQMTLGVYEVELGSAELVRERRPIGYDRGARHALRGFCHKARTEIAP